MFLNILIERAAKHGLLRSNMEEIGTGIIEKRIDGNAQSNTRYEDSPAKAHERTAAETVRQLNSVVQFDPQTNIHPTQQILICRLPMRS